LIRSDRFERRGSHFLCHSEKRSDEESNSCRLREEPRSLRKDDNANDLAPSPRAFTLKE